MVLNFGMPNMFKTSAEDGQVDKHYGRRTVPEDETDTTYSAGTGVSLTGTEFTSDDPNIDHDQTSNMEAGEHLDWAASQTPDVHADNYTDTGDTTYTAGTGVNLAGTEFTSDDSAIAHDSLSGFNADKHREWAASIAENVHGNNYTDTQPTKEIWFQASGSGATPVYYGSFLCYTAASGGGSVAGTVKLPNDFNSLSSMKVVLIPDASDATWDIDFDYHIAAIGEQFDTHTVSVNTGTYNLTEAELEEIDVTSQISGTVASGDYVGIDITNNDGTEDFFVMGIVLRYT